jgi:cell fate regulator YaaT (PSP1 superfamily)
MRDETAKPSGPDRERRGPGRRRRPRGRPAAGDEAPEPIPPDAQLVMVRFKGNRKACYHNNRRLQLRPGDYCIVEADRGRDMGRVSYIGPGKPHWWKQARRQGVLAVAEPDDLKRLHENRGDEWEFWDIAQEKIQARKLKMDLVTVERQFDHNKITFYFTAEKRVDFRELVRDLAAIFRTRIELRQIGVRDEARLKGGLGICGREFCCSSFLQEFSPVTLKMAKEQQLPLNPNKLSGPCGRLRCCLSYEHEGYREALGRLPRVNARVGLDGREGVVRKLDLVQELVTLRLVEGEEMVTVPVAEVRWQRGEDQPDPRKRPRRASRRRRGGGDAG